MPTDLQLEQESWWVREFEPPNLAKLNDALRKHFGVTGSYIGSKGNNLHLRGYHRSREWVLNSRYSLYAAADYSVQNILDRAGGDARWLAATDFQTRGGTPDLIQVCRRLDAAVRDNELPQIREWYGNIDGDQVVDGWDNVRDRAASSDTSHLWHLHMSFFRSRADDDHTHLFDVLTGDDMATVEEIWGAQFGPAGARKTAGALLAESRNGAVAAAAGVVALTAVVEQLAVAITAGGGSVDTAAILAGVDERLAALREQIHADVDEELDEQSRGGADADG